MQRGANGLRWFLNPWPWNSSPARRHPVPKVLMDLVGGAQRLPVARWGCYPSSSLQEADLRQEQAIYRRRIGMLEAKTNTRVYLSGEKNVEPKNPIGSSFIHQKKGATFGSGRGGDREMPHVLRLLINVFWCGWRNHSHARVYVMKRWRDIVAKRDSKTDHVLR